MSWADSLDMLAQNGILDYDAPAFVTGQNPRYVGSPDKIPSPFVGGVPNAPALKQPQTDSYSPNKENIVHPSSWKKWAFASLALGIVGIGIFNRKSIVNTVKNTFNNLKTKLSWKSIKTFISNKAKAVGKFFKKCWGKIKGIFKKP